MWLNAKNVSSNVFAMLLNKTFLHVSFWPLSYFTHRSAGYPEHPAGYFIYWSICLVPKSNNLPRQTAVIGVHLWIMWKGEENPFLRHSVWSSMDTELKVTQQAHNNLCFISRDGPAAGCLTEHPFGVPPLHSPLCILKSCSSPWGPHGCVVLSFSNLASHDYNKLPSLFPDMIESRLIDPLPLSLSLPRLEISQRGAATIDTGRSNKAGRLRGHRGAAHTVTPAITTFRSALPSLSFPNPLTFLSWLHGPAWFINNNSNIRGNKQGAW